MQLLSPKATSSESVLSGIPIMTSTFGNISFLLHFASIFYDPVFVRLPSYVTFEFQLDPLSDYLVDYLVNVVI